MRQRSERGQRLGLAVFLVCAVIAGSAFAQAQGSNLAWLDRDEISVTITEMTVVTDGEPVVRLSVEVHNPTGRAVRPQPQFTRIVVYDGSERTDESELTVPRTADVEETQVGPGETVTLTVTAEIDEGRVDETRRAVDSGRAEPSGILALRMQDRVYDADI